MLSQGCGGGSSPTTPTPTPVATSIILSVTSVTLDSIGNTAQLAATVKDQTGTVMAGKAITWASSDAAIVSVSSSGLVTAISPGTANITATHLSLSATASVVSQDNILPQVLGLSLDTTKSGGAMLNPATGNYEFYGTVGVVALVKDDHQLKAITVVYGDSVIYESTTLTGDSTLVTFDWDTRATSQIGGLADDTLGVVVWDTSDNIGAGFNRFVLMHQPNVVVNNLLTRPATLTFKSKDGGITYSTNTVAAQDTADLVGRVLSTDSVQLHWTAQREPHPGGVVYGYLGQEFNSWFLQRAANVDLTWEIDNVIGTGTYYTPHFSNSESNISEAYPIIDMNLIGEINICRLYHSWQYEYHCSIAPGAQYNEYGYYELSTTSRPGYQKKTSIRNGIDWCYWTYSNFVGGVAEGSGRVNFNVFTGACAEGAGNPSTGREAGSGGLIQPSSGPNPNRIPGAINDDEPSPFGLSSGFAAPTGPGWPLN